jgi:hypothetical protein
VSEKIWLAPFALGFVRVSAFIVRASAFVVGAKFRHFMTIA